MATAWPTTRSGCALVSTWGDFIAVFEDGQIVGGCHSNLLEVLIPGGSSVIAGVPNMKVQPTHTLWGIMTHMMLHQIDSIH